MAETSNMKLRPCPFCGTSDLSYHEEMLAISCDNLLCGALGPVGNSPDYEADARRLWNERSMEK